MKAEQAVKSVRRRQPAQPASSRRIWRVFEYRRPVPAQRRFSV
jgi:hypothetical protein